MVSHFLENLSEHLNAEIVSGTVTNTRDAVRFLIIIGPLVKLYIF